MSTKVGIIAEGPIDHALLPPLLGHISRLRAEFTWPLKPEDVVDHFPVRKRGHGGVLDGVKRLVEVLDTNGRTKPFDHACFVILLDRRTRVVQDEVRQFIRPHDRFVLGVAIEEIEAWWLADRKNTLNWAALKELAASLRYAQSGYRAEADDDPKRTLSELTNASSRFDRSYGEGNVDLATEFAKDYWTDFASIDDIRAQCPRGFGRFDDEMANLFRRVKAAE